MPPKKTEENNAQIDAGNGVGAGVTGDIASDGDGAIGTEQTGAEQPGSSEPGNATADAAAAQASTEPAAPVPDETLRSQAVVPAGSVEVRVLQVCEYGVPNDVIELEAAVAASAQKHGLVDVDPAAVAYARSLL